MFSDRVRIEGLARSQQNTVITAEKNYEMNYCLLRNKAGLYKQINANSEIITAYLSTSPQYN